MIWWLRQRVTELGVDTWFHPSVSIQRSEMDKNTFLRSFSKRPKDQVILLGDLLHVDFGITYLRLNTDQQQHFYMLKEGEKEVPAELQAAFAKGNQLQDILVNEFEPGKAGTRSLKMLWIKPKQKESMLQSTPIRLVCMVTLPAPPSGFGTSKEG